MGLSTQQIKFFADFIKKELGIIYTETNFYQLETRLEQVAKILNYENTEELYQKSQQGIVGTSKQVLLDISTNNETSFFRDPKIFAVFEKKIIPALKEINPNSASYRIWSAASSFGQEPYSLAMIVSEFLEKTPGHPQIRILTSDISDRALERTKQALYSQLEVQRGLPANKMIKYFQKTEDNYWKLNSKITQFVEVKKVNLLETFLHLGKFDVIFCRYVLIYQDQQKKKEILKKITDLLNPKGFLILGASESLFGLSEDFNQIAIEGAIYYQKKQ